jgi:hypothetical protein
MSKPKYRNLIFKQYGRAFFGFENAHPQGGINEAGLCFDFSALGIVLIEKI